MTSKGYSSLFSLEAASLHNEAQVETRFVAPLLKELNYPEISILPKERVPKLTGHDGSKKVMLEVDFLLFDPSGSASIIVEVKSPTEDISKYWGQAASYALSHNKSLHNDERGIEWLLITNGIMTALYPANRESAIVTLKLEDFSSGSPPLVTLKNYANYKERTETISKMRCFESVSPAALNALFDSCHDLIWKRERKSPTDAFFEFCKFIFLKIREDKKRSSLDANKPRGELPLTVDWLNAVSNTSEHPVRDILFRQLHRELEDSIREGKKRIYSTDETMRLSASTCKALIEKFENVNLSAIDEDLNGRMFEQFLNREIRGKELGQYFTPRPVVDFMTRIALHGYNVMTPPVTIDACAGTAGFLIEAMAHLTAAIRNDKRLTDAQKKDLIGVVHNKRLYGVEGNDRVCRVARINMYLHGDGGSHIFEGDGLDGVPSADADMGAERRNEVNDHAAKVRPESFDLVLSNPPFSMSYDAKNEDENRILKQRDIAGVLTKVKSNVLFLDRYHELLKPGGTMLIVLDDTVLNGKTQKPIREWILEKFVVLGIHSLPFNTFFKAKANIKTSILHVRKKMTDNEGQGYVFMSIANNVGHDNHCKDTPERKNLIDILMNYFEWVRTGQFSTIIKANQDESENLECPQQVWTVSPDKINPERLDSFYFSPDLDKCREELFSRQNKKQVTLRYGRDFNLAPSISRSRRRELSESETLLRYIEIGDVTPYGLIVNHQLGVINDLPTRGDVEIQTGDVLVAINNSSRGTVVLVPAEYDGTICTSGFRVIRPESPEQGKILWYALRSEYSRIQNYYLSQTASQPELKREAWDDDFIIPIPVGKHHTNAIASVDEFMDHIAALTGAGKVKLSMEEP